MSTMAPDSTGSTISLQGMLEEWTQDKTLSSTASSMSSPSNEPPFCFPPEGPSPETHVAQLSDQLRQRAMLMVSALTPEQSMANQQRVISALYEALSVLSKPDARAANLTEFLFSANTPDDVAVLTDPEKLRFATTLSLADSELDSSGAMGGLFDCEFASDMIMVPCDLHGSMSFGSVAVRRFGTHASCSKSDRVTVEDFGVGRYVRHEPTGELLVLLTFVSPGDSLDFVIHMTHKSATTRRHAKLAFETERFRKGDYVSAVRRYSAGTLTRFCPVCNAPPSMKCNCALPFKMPSSKNDLATVMANAAPMFGDFFGNIDNVVHCPLSGKFIAAPMISKMSTFPTVDPLRISYVQDAVVQSRLSYTNPVRDLLPPTGSADDQLENGVRLFGDDALVAAPNAADGTTLSLSRNEEFDTGAAEPATLDGPPGMNSFGVEDTVMTDVLASDDMSPIDSGASDCLSKVSDGSMDIENATGASRAVNNDDEMGALAADVAITRALGLAAQTNNGLSNANKEPMPQPTLPPNPNGGEPAANEMTWQAYALQLMLGKVRNDGGVSVYSTTDGQIGSVNPVVDDVESLVLPSISNPAPAAPVVGMGQVVQPAIPTQGTTGMGASVGTPTLVVPEALGRNPLEPASAPLPALSQGVTELSPEVLSSASSAQSACNTPETGTRNTRLPTSEALTRAAAAAAAVDALAGSLNMVQPHRMNRGEKPLLPAPIVASNSGQTSEDSRPSSPALDTASEMKSKAASATEAPKPKPVVVDPERIARQELRRQKNRAAATRSNAKRKERNENLRRDLAFVRERVQVLRARERLLQEENEALKQQRVASNP